MDLVDRRACLVRSHALVHQRLASLCDQAEEQHEEDHEDKHERQHHAHALQVPPLYDLVVRLDVGLTVPRTLPSRPQLAVAVTRRRLVQLPLGRLECVDLCVGVVSYALVALGEARSILWVVSADCVL